MEFSSPEFSLISPVLFGTKGFPAPFSDEILNVPFEKQPKTERKRRRKRERMKDFREGGGMGRPRQRTDREEMEKGKGESVKQRTEGRRVHNCNCVGSSMSCFERPLKMSLTFFCFQFHFDEKKWVESK